MVLEIIFYSYCWDTIKTNLVTAVQAFFRGATLPKAWTSMPIVIIPKVSNPVKFGDLRRISLCSYNAKVILKVISNRMASLLPHIISLEQSDFVKGRNIIENILLAQEMLHKLDSKVKGNNAALKLDMAKAYDRISWPFILKVLRQFGFDEKLIDIVWRLLSNC